MADRPERARDKGFFSDEIKKELDAAIALVIHEDASFARYVTDEVVRVLEPHMWCLSKE